jgi:DNA-binding transcriptional LysR family regulator
MKFNRADLFLCLVDAGSITAGARQANLALASASERISNIESDSGVVLLERSRRGVTTEAGEALAHVAAVRKYGSADWPLTAEACPMACAASASEH